MTLVAAATDQINLCHVSDCIPLRTFDSVRLKIGQVTCIIFHSRKINLLGARSLFEADKTVIALQKKLRIDLAKPKIVLSNPVLKNVVAHYNLIPQPLDIKLLFEYWRERGVKGSVYLEPELYPALKIKTGLGTVLAYHTGKVLLTGVKMINHLYQLQRRFNSSVCSVLGPHDVTMAAPRPKTLKPRVKKSKSCDDLTKLLDELMEDPKPPEPPKPMRSFNFQLCDACAADLFVKRKHWRKRLDKHLVSMLMCTGCFKVNFKVLRGPKDDKPRACNPDVPEHTDGKNCNCWDIPMV